MATDPLRISALPNGGPVTGAERVPVVQDGVTVGIRADEIGQHRGPPSSTDKTLARMRGTEGDYQGSAVTLGDAGEIHGYRVEIKVITAATYTLLPSDSGKKLEFERATDIAVTIPNDLPKGWACSWTQVLAGKAVFAAASGATLRNAEGHAKSAKAWAEGTLYVRATSGSDAEAVLSGVTAA